MSRVVTDASALVALLLDDGAGGRWVAERLGGAELAAPSLARYEAANVIRRHELTGAVSPDLAAQAHADLLDLEIEEWPYTLLAGRSWELRTSLTAYDASYVALAELLESTLVTLDRGMRDAPGVRCAVDTP